MENKSTPFVSIILIGGTEVRKSEILNRLNKYSRNDNVEVINIQLKKDEVSINGTKTIIINKKRNLYYEIASKVLSISKCNYFIFWNVLEEEKNIEVFLDYIHINKSNTDTLVLTSGSNKSKQAYSIEDLPQLLANKELLNIAFPRNILQEYNSKKNQYAWKANLLLAPNSIFKVKRLPASSDEKDQNISFVFPEINEAIQNYKSNIMKLDVNQYQKNDLIKEYYELIFSGKISKLYRSIVKERNSRKQVSFFKELMFTIINMENTIITRVPAIRYYFIRWTIDNYNSLSLSAKREHLNILGHVIKKLHHDDHLVYISKHKYLYSAAIKSVRYNSILPIYIYLIKRKIKRNFARKN
ncbi:MAG: hypothetical protein U9Q88_11025 [Bacillota bacterium]|nr:hypothetical protein [Bacillota bacterium]